MKTICKSCGMAFPANPEFIGCKVECPNCGAQFELREESIIKAAPRRSSSEPVKSSFDALGFVLGLLLNVPGVFIAALISGRRGAISALWALLIDGIVAAIGWALIFAS